LLRPKKTTFAVEVIVLGSFYEGQTAKGPPVSVVVVAKEVLDSMV